MEMIRKYIGKSQTWHPIKWNIVYKHSTYAPIQSKPKELVQAYLSAMATKKQLGNLAYAA